MFILAACNAEERPKSCKICTCDFNKWECQHCTSPMSRTLLATNLEDSSPPILTENSNPDKLPDSTENLSSNPELSTEGNPEEKFDNQFYDVLFSDFI